MMKFLYRKFIILTKNRAVYISLSVQYADQMTNNRSVQTIILRKITYFCLYPLFHSVFLYLSTHIKHIDHKFAL